MWHQMPPMYILTTCNIEAMSAYAALIIQLHIIMKQYMLRIQAQKMVLHNTHRINCLHWSEVVNIFLFFRNELNPLAKRMYCLHIDDCILNTFLLSTSSKCCFQQVLKTLSHNVHTTMSTHVISSNDINSSTSP